MQRRLTLLAAATFLACTSASASLVYDDSIFVSAQGFGNAPRDLTVQATGNATTESGCIAPTAGSPGTPDFGSSACTPEAAVHDANGVADTGGDEPNPLVLDQGKYGLPTFGSLGITDAGQIGILYNATEPGGNGANLQNLTLSIYGSTGTLLGAIDGSINLTNTQPGNGSAGFVFVVSTDERDYINGLISPDNILGLGALIAGISSGPESFRTLNLSTLPPPPDVQVPEPGTLALLGLGLLAVGTLRRRRG